MDYNWEDESIMDSGSIGFVMICAAFVFFMTPGLSYFYGGLVRRKNAVNTMFASVITIGTGIVMWVLFGYSLSFGTDHFGIIGDLSWLGLEGVSKTEAYVEGQSIPNLVFCLFQMMFAVITPALITGSVGGRMKFKSLFFFIVFWSILVYYPMAHMVWADGGFLAKIGSVDFAGGNVVHISSGVTALVLCILLGKRYDHERANYKIHNIPFVAMGAFILMFGWFGFNAGLVAGLVGITPGAGFVPIWAAVIIGLTTSPICYFMVSVVKRKLGYDDALDAFGCHGVGGIWGGICTGLFCQASINDIGQGNGLFFGDVKLFLMQLVSILVTIAVAVAGTFICYFLTKLVSGGSIRVTEREERVGLDRSEHGEAAYPSFNGLD